MRRVGYWRGSPPLARRPRGRGRRLPRRRRRRRHSASSAAAATATSARACRCRSITPGAVPGQLTLRVQRLRSRIQPGARGGVRARGRARASRPPRPSRGDGGGAALRGAPQPRRDRLRPARHRPVGRAALPLARGRATCSTPPRRRRRCAAALGPRRGLLHDRRHVEDMEAIRRELGVERIAIYGTSYGTKVALAYALRYPAHVERLVLDSVVEADGPDPLYRDTFAATPRALRALCRRLLPVLHARSGGRSRAARGAPARAAACAAGSWTSRAAIRRSSSRRGPTCSACCSPGTSIPRCGPAFPGAVRSALARRRGVACCGCAGARSGWTASRRRRAC